jgi:hypothetical protein
MDPKSIDASVAQLKASPPPPITVPLPSAAPWLETERPIGPSMVGIDIVPNDPTAPSWTVRVTFGAPLAAGATVKIVSKAFPSSASWSSVTAASISSTVYAASLPNAGDGGMFAVEIEGPPGQAWHYPDPTRGVPYVVLAPK